MAVEKEVRELERRQSSAVWSSPSGAVDSRTAPRRRAAGLITGGCRTEMTADRQCAPHRTHRHLHLAFLAAALPPSGFPPLPPPPTLPFPDDAPPKFGDCGSPRSPPASSSPRPSKSGPLPSSSLAISRNRSSSKLGGGGSYRPPLALTPLAPAPDVYLLNFSVPGGTKASAPSTALSRTPAGGLVRGADGDESVRTSSPEQRCCRGSGGSRRLWSNRRTRPAVRAPP